MPDFEITAIVVLALLAWFWLDSLKARDAGMMAARDACASEGFQLLDDTVAIASLRLARNDAGQVRLRRVYDFEFSETGDNRRRGNVVLLGHNVLVVNIGLRLVSSGQTLH
jgi:hypothetical protein